MVTYTGKVLYSTASYKNNRVFLKIVAVLRTCLVSVTTSFVEHSILRVLTEECSPVLNTVLSVLRPALKSKALIKDESFVARTCGVYI